MELAQVTYRGPDIDDTELVARLPENLAALLGQINGWIQFHGGFHLRGVCREPVWHSLRAAMDGAHALHRLYPEIRQTDVPFAEDCMGDQFVLREGVVARLAGETGELEDLGASLGSFLARVQADPVEFLLLQPLLQFQREGGALAPGQSLASYPPFCMKEAADDVTCDHTSAADRRRPAALIGRPSLALAACGGWPGPGPGLVHVDVYQEVA